MKKESKMWIFKIHNQKENLITNDLEKDQSKWPVEISTYIYLHWETEKQFYKHEHKSGL